MFRHNTGLNTEGFFIQLQDWRPMDTYTGTNICPRDVYIYSTLNLVRAADCGY